MSGGQLELYGEVSGWADIRSYLLQNDINTHDEPDEVDWGNTTWGWGNELASQSDTKVKESILDNDSSVSEKTSSSWLDDCILSNSPVGDALAVAKGSKAIFFTADCRIDPDRTNYVKSFEGILSEEEGETITSLACIPLISQKRTSPGAPDWTCFVVGFSRGFVRIYTETGNQLVSQQFHNERVQSFKVRSFVASRISLQHDQLEELVVVYRTVLVTIDGFGLFQMLRGCRNHLARMKANATDSTMEPPVLSSKKWGFENDQTISDCEMVGLNTPSAFDHLFTASLLGGFHATPNLNPPTASVFSTVGNKPFLAFHHAQENQAPPILTEMAYAVASKVKSSILNAATGWLGFGTTNSGPTTTKTMKEITFDVPTPMSFRSGLSDQRRHGKIIICSPERNLSVATDGLGRVTLIDNSSGLVVRMWKGYRDAQCAWLQVEEHLSSRAKGREQESRTALFLVIYAPRRERLEIFAMQQGPKVATFEVNRRGRLMSTTYGMMGLSNVQQKVKSRHMVECLFLDSDGKLFTLNIPFHLSLCDKASSKLKDLHLLKALQKLLRDGQYTENSIVEVLMELRTQAMINQAFRMLTQKCLKASILQIVLQLYSNKCCNEEDKDLTVVFRIESLLELYLSLVKSQASPPAYQKEEAGKDDKSLLFCLHSSEKEMSMLERMVAEEMDGKQFKSKSVKFVSDSGGLNLNEFFACFGIEYDPIKIKASNSTSVPINFKFDEIEKLGELLFCGCLNGTLNLDDWQQKLRNAGLEASEILILAFKYWCGNTALCINYITFMEKLYHVVKTLCDLEGYTSVISDFNQVSKWWEDIRKEITSSPQVFSIYTFSIVCRAVAIDLQQKQRTMLPCKQVMGDRDPGLLDENETESLPTTSATNIETDFENVSLDLLKWNILLKQIEDLSLLSSILVQRPKLNVQQLPVLKGQVEALTVIKLLDKGKGCIAELVGRWLTTIGIEPGLITRALQLQEVSALENSKGLVTITQIESGIEAVKAEKSLLHVLDLLKSLQDNFSVSLTASIILSNYCWEYCLEWKNETDNVEFLGAAIECAGAIPSPYIRQGMMSMMWTIFLSKRLSGVTSISKTSREKLADKSGGFSSHEKKLAFLGHSVRFLDLFMEASGACNGSTPPSHSTLKNHWSSEVNSNASLTDLALLQPLANFDMIILHYQLALCAQCFYTFRLKGTLKPTNLFDTKSSMLLFQSLQNPTQLSHVEVDLALKTLREEFLCRTISGAIRVIPEDSDSLSTGTVAQSEFKRVVPSLSGVKECELWVSKCLDLGRIWRMELDGIRISYACELYSSGLDLLGAEAIPLVQGRDVLGTRLLLIAGMRTSYLINQRRDNVTDIISSVSTNLSKWLDSLEYSNLRSLRFSKESIGELLIQLIQLIPESNYDFKLAEELLQLCNTLESDAN